MKNIAVFGYSRFTYEALARIDRLEHHILIVDHDPDQYQAALDCGFNASNIDFRSDSDLKSIGIGSSIDTLFCFFDTDSENVFLTLSARALDKDLKIIALVDSPESAEKLLAAGANKIIDPYEICARKIHSLLTRPDITSLFDHTVFGQQDLQMAEIVIPERCELLGRNIQQLALESLYNLLPIGLMNKQDGDEMTFIVDEPKRLLFAGDILVVLGPSREIKTFKQFLAHELDRD
jgi:voltage-gated potassium channel